MAVPKPVKTLRPFDPVTSLAIFITKNSSITGPTTSTTVAAASRPAVS